MKLVSISTESLKPWRVVTASGADLAVVAWGVTDAGDVIPVVHDGYMVRPLEARIAYVYVEGREPLPEVHRAFIAAAKG